MTTYCLNTTGTGVGGTTWVTAFTTWVAASGAMAAGDVLFVDSAFNTVPAGQTVTFPGTPASPNIIISGTPGSAGTMTAYVAGALLASSNTTFTVNGSFRAKGVTFNTQSGSSHDMLIGTATTNSVVLDLCALRSTGAGGSSRVYVGTFSTDVGSSFTAKNCTIKFGAAGQSLYPDRLCMFDGLTLESGGTSPTSFCTPAPGAHSGEIYFQALDLTNASAGINLVSAPTQSGIVVRFNDVRLPASWSGALAGTLKVGNHIEMWNGDNGNTNYKMKVLDYAYTANENTSIYVTGTTVAAQAMSIKVDTTANCSWASVGKVPLTPILVDQSSGTYTVTCEIARDGSATPYLNSDIWLEVEYLGTSSSTLGVVTDNACDLLTFVNSGGSNITSSAAAWTGLGGTNNTMKLQVTITPKKPGYILPKVCFAKASSTCYVDPGVSVV